MTDFVATSDRGGGSSAPPRARAHWVDRAKGIGILLVVLVHTWRGIRDGGLVRKPELFELFELLDAGICTFVMPLFFLLSGLFLERAARRSTSDFFADKARALAYPYVLWTVLYTVINAPFARASNLGGSLGEVVPAMLYRPFFHLWFVYVLGLGSALYFVLRRARCSPLSILIAAIAWYASTGHVSLGRWDALSSLRWYFSYLAAGAALSAAIQRKLEQLAALPAAVTSLACLGTLASLVASSLAHTSALYWLEACLGIASALTGSVALGAARGVSRALAVLGKYSLEIYLAHAFGTGGARLLLQYALHVRSISVHFVVGVTVGVALPLSLALAAQRARFAYLWRWPRATPRPQASASLPF